MKPALEPRYRSRVTVTVLSHVELKPKELERQIRIGVGLQLDYADLESPFRDTSIEGVRHFQTEKLK